MKKIFFLLIIFLPNVTFAASMSMIGEKGKVSEVSKVIEIKMYDNYYEPNIIDVKNITKAYVAVGTMKAISSNI